MNVMEASVKSKQEAKSEIKLRQLSGFFGAEVSGISLTNDVSEEAVSQLWAALDQYRVLVFRNQGDVSPNQLLSFASHFGTPETKKHPTHDDAEGAIGVKVLHSNATEVGGRVLDMWHTDGSTRENTNYISFLQAIDVPDYGRDTMFADMVVAYERLSEPVKAFIDGLVAEHSWGVQNPGAPSVYHPVVLPDRRTGKKALYVNRLYTRAIQGLRNDESEALLEFLMGQARIPELQLRVSWEPGTITMWNNELTQHHLVFDRAYARTMHRVMVS